jgi:hypothetical protein
MFGFLKKSPPAEKPDAEQQDQQAQASREKMRLAITRIGSQFIFQFGNFLAAGLRLLVLLFRIRLEDAVVPLIARSEGAADLNQRSVDLLNLVLH